MAAVTATAVAAPTAAAAAEDQDDDQDQPDAGAVVIVAGGKAHICHLACRSQDILCGEAVIWA